MSEALETRLGPLTLKNPIVTASGTFGYGLEFTDFVDLSKLGGICTKGLSLRPHAGNEPPRICETPAGMLNAIGLQ
ncbi:MAG: dihydroorotate dehydrogenase, partial [Acidobacteriota bacterium]|nr:dihydroorotate dehydrogenase [Acidobacteriota bacterium]